MYLPGLIKLAKDVCGQVEMRLVEEEWQGLIGELEKAISNLPEKEHQVIAMQYDLEGTGAVSSRAEIAKVLGACSEQNRRHNQGVPYTRSWISELQKRALRSLKRCFPVPQISLEEFVKKNGDYYPVSFKDLFSRKLVRFGDEFSLRARIKLDQSQIRTIGDLAKKTEAELVQLGFGRKLIAELNNFLEARGLGIGKSN